KQRFPSARARFCTELLKMEPTRKHIQYYEWICGYTVTAHSGVRAAESDERATLDEYDQDDYLGVKVRRPLLTWSIADVWHAHQRYGLPINPIYLSGRRRVGCRLCCMSSKQDVRLTVKHQPWVIDLYREWEKSINNRCGYSSFFARNAVPLIQRTKEITTKTGAKMMVCSIDDVARWSQTLRGGTQGGFDFMFAEDENFDAGLTCKSIMGHCE
ncbi:MAG TPA: phosphoadenosine phosphosulfate reductase family protein, partial [Verrucomicrobiae bacterium]